MSQSCRLVDDTFGPYAGSCRGGFDFTLLFEESVLSILPLCLLLVVLPFRVLYLFRRAIKVNQHFLLLSKLVWPSKIVQGLVIAILMLTYLILQVLYALYAILHIVLTALWASPEAVRTKASIANAAVTIVGTLALSVLSLAEHQRNIRPSLLLEAYFLLTLFFDAARVRTTWLQGYNNAPAGVSTAALAIKFFLLAAEIVTKRNILRSPWTGQSPEATSGLFGKTLFLWLNQLFRTGYNKSLSIEDLTPLDKHLTSDYLWNRLHQPWSEKSNKGPRSLLMLFFGRLKWRLLAAVPPRLGLIAFNFCQPFLITRAVEFNQQPVNGSTTNAGYGLIGAYFIVYCGIAVTMGQYQHLTYRAITMARGGLISMMFDKVPLVQANAADPASSLTLMSADIERITNGWTTMHECWANVIEVALAIYLLERQLGVACAIPIGVAVGKFDFKVGKPCVLTCYLSQCPF